MYGFNEGNYSDAAWPLHDDADWFFHGYQDDEPEEVCDLPAGGTFMAEIACNRIFTSYGHKTTDPNDPTSACPDRSAATSSLRSRSFFPQGAS